MNDKIPADASVELPELSEESIGRIEEAVFETIAAERTPAHTPTVIRRRPRRRAWLTGIGVAAAFAAGVVVTAPILTMTSTTTGSAVDATALHSDGARGGAEEMSAPDDVSLDAAGGVQTGVTDREIIAGASASLRVDDVRAAAEAVTALATDLGGYVETTDLTAVARTDERIVPRPDGRYGWISIRVPAETLTEAIEELGEVGEVVSSSTSKQDVTAAAIDLRARIDAAEASVERLTELMAQSGSVSELIDAEMALTDRQAQLESYTQQLASLEDEVAMSSLQVELTERTSVAPAEPDGFADGLLAGWNGLIVSLNAVVVAIGFALPWLALIGVALAVFWLIRRARRRTHNREIS
ncbi:DUF4349 domain-containing protein [Microbacterium paludicola]|uniref:DUF4349 domain-containing protein n=1 Tax=Microbacterium paludicola TaxID=300019 RepID=UPI0011A77661|nr:DUF4349 domain-containing protein [Microbacterium paludicola]